MKMDERTRVDLVTVVALGALAGSRSMLPQVVLSRALRERRRPAWLSWLAAPAAARVFATLATLELVADKLPGVPARVASLPLLGRALSGAAAGFVTAKERREHAPLFALVGAAAALAASIVSYRARRYAMERWGMSSAGSGLLEDGLALMGAQRLERRLGHGTSNGNA